MSSSGAIRAGRAYVEMFADNSQLVRTLKSTQTMFGGWGKKLANVGAAGAGLGAGLAGSLVGAGQAFASTGAELDDMKNRTGITAQALSELKHAAGQSDTSLESLQAGLFKMNKLMSAAGTNDKLRETITDLGLNFEELQKLSPDQQFEAFAEAIGSIQNPAERSAAAMRIFGKGGTDLLPLLNEGADGIAALRKQARDLGLTMSDEDATAAAVLDDSLATVWATVKALTVQVGGALAPTLTQATQRISEVVGGTAKWVAENRGLVTTVVLGAASVAAAFAIGGAASATLAAGLKILSFGIQGVIISGQLLTGTFAFLASPIGIVIAGLVAGTAAFLAYTDAGKALVGTLGSLFPDLLGTAIATFNGIGEALASGDLTQAANVLWAGLDLAWSQGVAALTKYWAEWVQGVETTMTLYFSKAKVWFLENFAGDLIEGFNYIEKAWNRLANGMYKTWSNAVGSISDLTIHLMHQAGAIDDLEGALEANRDITAQQNKEADASLVTKQKQADQRRLDLLKTAQKELEKAKATSTEEGASQYVKNRNEQAVADAQGRLAEAQARFDELTRSKQVASAEQKRVAVQLGQASRSTNFDLIAGAGTTSSFRLGQYAAMGTVNKHLDETKKSNKILEEIRDGIDDLEGTFS